MAVYFHNSLLASADFIRTTRRFSSPQSLSRGSKRGTIQTVAIGRFRFIHTSPEQVAAFYSIPSWDGLPVITGNTVPGGLTSLNRISKKTGVGEAVIMSWALLNRLDVYWISGVLFAHLHLVQPIAQTEKERMASLTKPPKVRRRARYL